MADIRINSLPSTASASSSDDFLALDGATNGTRKLNAYSPTFGGNLTVSGTGTSSFQSTTPSTVQIANTTSGLADTQTAANNVVLGTLKFGHPSDGQSDKFPSIVGRFDPTDASFARATQLEFYTSNAAGNALRMTLNKDGNLTVSGTGNSSFAGNIRLPWSTPSLLSYYDATYSLGFVFDSANRKLVLRAQSADAPANGKGTIAFESGATPSEIARFAPSTGNFLLGTTTDSGNGRIQLATHTTSASGIGFGTDISLYRDTNSTLNGTAPGGYALNRTGMNGVGLATGVNVASDAKTANDAIGISLSLQNSSSAAKTYGQIYAEINSATASSENGSLVLRTIKAGTLTTALTLDSSQNATFAGTTVNVSKAGNNPSFKATDGAVITKLQSQTAGDTTGAIGTESNHTLKLITNNTTRLTIAATGDATFTGAIAIGNTVNTVSPTSPNRTITMVIGGTTYYIHAKTTND